MKYNNNYQILYDLGIFIHEQFFKPELCSKIIKQMKSFNLYPAKVLKQNGKHEVDYKIRKVNQSEVSSEIFFLVKRRLRAIQPSIELYYNTQIKYIENPQFLLYKAGDYIRPHTDNKVSKKRKITAIIFLTRESCHCNVNCYKGGSLILYGLIKDEIWKNYGFPVHGFTGLLVAFPSNTVHEVEHISFGERYVISSWFY